MPLPACAEVLPSRPCLRTVPTVAATVRIPPHPQGWHLCPGTWHPWEHVHVNLRLFQVGLAGGEVGGGAGRWVCTAAVNAGRLAPGPSKTQLAHLVVGIPPTVAGTRLFLFLHHLLLLLLQLLLLPPDPFVSLFVPSNTRQTQPVHVISPHFVPLTKRGQVQDVHAVIENQVIAGFVATPPRYALNQTGTQDFVHLRDSGDAQQVLALRDARKGRICWVRWLNTALE